MFTRISKITLFALAAIGLFSLTSCKKDKDKTIDLHFEYNVGSEAFNYNQTYTINGTAITFTTVQFYVSGVTLMDDDNSMSAFEDTYLLVKPEQEHYELGVVSENMEDHAHMLNFNVGVDAATNAQTTEDFTSRPDDGSDPLGAQSPSMAWTWNSGYIFLRIDGMVDTSGNGSPDATCTFHLGTDDLLRPVSIMAHKDLEDGENEIAINFDVAALFNGIDLSTENVTMTMGNKPLATKVADNIASAFSKAN